MSDWMSLSRDHRSVHSDGNMVQLEIAIRQFGAQVVMMQIVIPEASAHDRESAGAHFTIT
jgi:hypothetical protein